jgi:multiple antibiotic resistance protein
MKTSMFDQVLLTATYFLGAFVALITIMNPFSTASIFLTITANNTKKEKREIIKKACITAGILLIIFSLAGTLILQFFSITIDAFRIAGGLLITNVGLGMLHNTQPYKKGIHEEEALAKDDVSLIPLAIPMLSGPGAMTTAIVLMAETGNLVQGWPLVISLLFAIVAACVVSFYVLKQSIKIEKYIGHNERIVITKIMGLIVLVMGIQFIINGILSIFGL